MFVVYCPTCDRRALLGLDEVEYVHNLASGVISVSGHCPRGHPAVLLTGAAFTDRATASGAPCRRTPRSGAAR